MKKEIRQESVGVVNLNVAFTTREHKKLLKKKGKRNTWHDFIMTLAED